MDNDKGKRLVLIGGGRVAGVVYSTFCREYEVLGFVDDVYGEDAYLGTTYGARFLGSSADLPALAAQGFQVIVAIAGPQARRKYGRLIDSLRLPVATLVFPTAVIDQFARTGEGCIVRHQAVVSAQARLGRHCVVSDLAYVGHDAVIGDHTYISPGVCINGSVEIGEACLVGTGAVILPDLRIGDGCTIGAAACVTVDVPDGQTVAGVPARPIHPAA